MGQNSTLELLKEAERQLKSIKKEDIEKMNEQEKAEFTVAFNQLIAKLEEFEAKIESNLQ
jgi:hypothetical protein